MNGDPTQTHPVQAPAPASGGGRGARRKLAPEEVNPYIRHVHEHPAVLLAEPTPEALRERWSAPGMTAGPGSPLVLDLGCGSGNFLLEVARTHLETRFVGFELRYKRLVKGARKIEREGLSNVWLLRAQAEHFAKFFEPGTVSRVHVNFPDPWPRAGERRKRLVREDFLEALHTVLAQGGRFCFKTDHSGYFLHVLALLEGRKEWRIRTFRNDVLRFPLPEPLPRSEFEQLFRSMGKSIHYLELEKTGVKR